MSGVLWVVVWVVLVLGAAVSAAVLWHGLWRRVRALGAELERAGAVVGRLEERIAELTPPPEAPRLPAVVDDAAREAVRARRADLRAARRARSQRRVDRAVARWRGLGLVR